MRKINLEGFKLITHFEGCRLKAYKDVGGVLTVGHGHTGKDVKPGLEITQEEADILLESDLTKFEEAVSRNVKVTISDNQFAALVSFAYNIGEGALQTSSVLRYTNMEMFEKAATYFEKWDKVNGKQDSGLLKRRLAERDLYLS